MDDAPKLHGDADLRPTVTQSAHGCRARDLPGRHPTRSTGRTRPRLYPAADQTRRPGTRPATTAARKVGEPTVIAALQAARPEAIIVVAYGQLLPKSILTLPPHGCLNVHASLLPKYRGAAPISWAIIRGETVTGVTMMQIEARMDAGPLLLQRAEPIRPHDTTATLSERLAVLGAKLLCQTLDQVARDTVHLVPQDECRATYAPKLLPTDTHLDWARDAWTLDCLIRGLCPAPGAVTNFGERHIKVLQADVEAAVDSLPGTVCAVDQKKGYWWPPSPEGCG
ncbi:MAG: methionyl-tRNA formyltransferase [Candidatus Methylomirabilis sp.]|nr:methionyl-tRNA formyltransferase [Candidatus Methylomirabilis sp.]